MAKKKSSSKSATSTKKKAKSLKTTKAKKTAKKKTKPKAKKSIKLTKEKAAATYDAFMTAVDDHDGAKTAAAKKKCCKAARKQFDVLIENEAEFSAAKLKRAKRIMAQLEEAEAKD